MKKLTAILALLLLTIVAGCSGHPTPLQVKPAKPISNDAMLRVAIIADLSKSASDSNTPTLQIADLSPLLSAVAEHGGEIGIVAVFEKLIGGMVRMKIDPRSSMPDVLDAESPELVKLPVFERRNVLLRNRRDIDAWKAEENARRLRADAAIRNFQAEAASFLNSTRTDNKSDVYSALLRADRFLMEPSETRIVKILIAASDLVETRNVGETYRLASAPLTAWIPGNGKLGRLPGTSPVMFEAIAPAVNWAVSTIRRPNDSSDKNRQSPSGLN
jgi:hypothetical protein